MIIIRGIVIIVTIFLSNGRKMCFTDGANYVTPYIARNKFRDVHTEEAIVSSVYYMTQIKDIEAI